MGQLGQWSEASRVVVGWGHKGKKKGKGEKRTKNGEEGGQQSLAASDSYWSTLGTLIRSGPQNAPLIEQLKDTIFPWNPMRYLQTICRSFFLKKKANLDIEILWIIVMGCVCGGLELNGELLR